MLNPNCSIRFVFEGSFLCGRIGDMICADQIAAALLGVCFAPSYPHLYTQSPDQATPESLRRRNHPHFIFTFIY